jgi:signal transduction histidine kinase
MKSWDLVDAVFSEQTGIFDNLVAVSGLDRAVDFRDRSMMGFDFTAADIRGFDFSGSDLRGTNVQDARLIDHTTIFDTETTLDDDAALFLASRNHFIRDALSPDLRLEPNLWDAKRPPEIELDNLPVPKLDTLQEGVALFDADGFLVMFNSAFSEMWEFRDPAALRARPHISAISDHCRLMCSDPEVWDDLAELIAERGDNRAASLRMELKNNVTLHCTGVSLPDAKMVTTFRNVTAAANIERALTSRNEALVAASKLRDAFVNHVSYELRTPLTNIIGFTQLLAGEGLGALNTKQKEYAGFITDSSHALLAMIDDILDLASIDAGALELQFEPVHAAEAMRTAAEGVRDRLQEASIELRIVITDGVDTFIADGRRVRQVLFNLLSNAINYSEAGQTVTLAAQRRGDEIVFTVSDRGRGIPAEVVDRVFERFESFPNGSRHHGPGLGLSLVRSIVELHGGRVLIDTAPNEGTTVKCIFPTSGPQRATAPTALAEKSDSAELGSLR